MLHTGKGRLNKTKRETALGLFRIPRAPLKAKISEVCCCSFAAANAVASAIATQLWYVQERAKSTGSPKQQIALLQSQ